MAKNSDPVPRLSEKLEQLPASPASALYRLEQVPGKGIGCIATQEIKEGALVLREASQLIRAEDPGTCPGGAVGLVLKAFKQMSSSDRKAYLKLHNKFDENKPTTWTEAMQMEYQHFVKVLNEVETSDMSKAKSLKVLTIYASNYIGNGVPIKKSRFNHSCSPNTVADWNEETNIHEVKALVKIKQGEEITIPYLMMVKPRAWRRFALKEWYCFDCRCHACEISDQEAEKEDLKFRRYKELAEQKEDIFKRIQNSSRNSEAIETLLRRMEEFEQCLKELYTLGKELKVVQIHLQYQVVKEAYNVSCAGAETANLASNFLKLTDHFKTAEIVWIKKAMMYGEIELTMAKTLIGEDNSLVKEQSDTLKKLDLRFRRLLRE